MIDVTIIGGGPVGFPFDCHDKSLPELQGRCAGIARINSHFGCLSFSLNKAAAGGLREPAHKCLFELQGRQEPLLDNREPIS